MLCDAKSHTTQCSVMWSHTPPFIEYSLTLRIVMWCKVTHHPSLSIVLHFELLWCKVTHHPSLNIVSHFSLLWDVKAHTTLHWINFIRNSEDCFPTSFDKPYILWYHHYGNPQMALDSKAVSRPARALRSDWSLGWSRKSLDSTGCGEGRLGKRSLGARMAGNYTALRTLRSQTSGMTTGFRTKIQDFYTVSYCIQVGL